MITYLHMDTANTYADAILSYIPYFFGYKIDFFPSKTIQKNLDLSYKKDLDLLDCLGRVKLVL